MLSWYYNRGRRYKYSYTVGGWVYRIVGFVIFGVPAIVVLSSILIGPEKITWIDLGSLFFVLIGIHTCLRFLRPGIIFSRNIDKRRRVIAALNTKKPNPHLKTTELFNVLNPSDGLATISVANGDGWCYRDLKLTDEYTIIPTKTGQSAKIKGEYRYVSLLELKLPRKLPHIVLLSKKSRGTLVSLYLNKAQIEKVGFDGELNKYFKLYTPMQYHIDVRSIISPEVIEQILYLKRFDIEIIDDKLYVYGGLIDLDKVASVITQAVNVEKVLSDHIVNYHDDLLDDQTDRQNVAVFGKRLKESISIPVLMSIGGLLGLAVSVFAVVNSDTPKYFWSSISMSILAVSWIIFNILHIVSIVRKNLQQDKELKREQAKQTWRQ